MRNTNINSYDKTIKTFTKIYRPKSLIGIKKIFRSAKKNKEKISFRGNGQSYGDQPFITSNITGILRVISPSESSLFCTNS